MNAMRICATLLMAAMLLPPPASLHGQTFAPPTAPDPTLSRKDVAGLVESLADLMGKSYVDSLRGLEVRRKLRERMRAGAYRTFNRPRPLAAQLVADVQAVIDDGHFNILYFPPEAEGFSWVNSSEGKPRYRAAELEESRKLLRGENFGVSRAEILDGNIGWLTISKFNAPIELFREPLAAAFGLLRNTDALIIDLRRNPGGNQDCVMLAFSYFVDGPEQLMSTEYIRSEGKRVEFRTHPDPGGPKYLDRPVYVLTSEATGSGAEMFVYQMKNHRKGTLVGGRTSGAAHGFNTYQIGTSGIGSVMVLVPDSRNIDALTQGDWEKVGVAPDVATAPDEAPLAAQRLALETLADRAGDEARRAELRRQIDKMAYRAARGAPQGATLEKYAGRYGIRRVWLEGEHLRIQRDSGPPVDLEPTGEHLFDLNVAMSPKPWVRFEVENGRATAMVIRLPGGEERIERTP